MIKVNLFFAIDGLEGVYEYRRFIDDNQGIEIISVNILDHNVIVLTYKEENNNE